MDLETEEEGCVEPRNRFYIVGIGASAGGLEALTGLLSHLPTDLGAAFVVVQHLSPTYRSMLVQLLSRETGMAVKEVEAGETPAPNVVYVTPPNRNLLLRDGVFQLLEPGPNAMPKPSVNAFLYALAEERADDSIAVILSGTGSDGASGVRAIKAGGGLVFAQDPESAKYAGMPQAAIDTGCVDWVLAPEAMADELASVIRTVGVVVPPDKTRNAPISIGALLARVFRHTRVDFSGYKENTVWRRILRRIATNRVESLEQYIELTERNPDELGQLAKEILISVTAFFRDPETFSALADRLAERLAERTGRDEFRVWVPGCATGEEAFSLAILIADLCRKEGLSPRVQIFATDIDMTAMAIARRGQYPAAALAELPDDLVERYFSPVGDVFEISKGIREMVVFARQDLLQDPPFLRLDLISCRNVLIYFQNPLQEKVLGIFHYALAPKGLLLLGKSEGVQCREELFSVMSHEARLFQRSDAPARPQLGGPGRIARVYQRQERERSNQELLLEAAAGAYVPPSVLLDGSADVLQVFGDTSLFLQIPAGRPDLNVLNLIRKDLRTELQALLHQCRQRREPVSGRPRLLADTGEVTMRLMLRPVPDAARNSMMLLSFETQCVPVVSQIAESSAPALATRDLEDELIATREHLQTVVEELETSSEETQALNEELQASNEELQASNEELQSANEELQSTNEELTTVNEELQVKTAELTELNADLESIQNSFGFSLLVVTEQMRLIRFNNVAARYFGLDDNALGETLRSVLSRRGLESHAALADEVVGDGRPRERQVSDDRCHYLMRVFPRPVERSGALGAVLTLIDETGLIEMQRDLRVTQSRLLAIMDNSNALISVKDTLGRYQYVNPRFAELTGVDRSNLANVNDSALFGEESAAALRRRDLDVLASGNASESEETLNISGTLFYLRTLRFVLRGDDGAITGLCVKSNDVTRYRADRERARAHMDAWRALAAEMRHVEVIEFDLQGEPLESEAGEQGQNVYERLTALGFDVQALRQLTDGRWEAESSGMRAVARRHAQGGVCLIAPGRSHIQ